MDAQPERLRPEPPPEPAQRKRLVRFNVPGHAHFPTFSVYQRLHLLTNDLWRAWLAEEVRRACTGHDVALWAYVFMPDHVHLLVKPRRETYDLALLLKAAVRSGRPGLARSTRSSRRTGLVLFSASSACSVQNRCRSVPTPWRRRSTAIGTRSRAGWCGLRRRGVGPVTDG